MSRQLTHNPFESLQGLSAPSASHVVENPLPSRLDEDLRTLEAAYCNNEGLESFEKLSSTNRLRIMDLMRHNPALYRRLLNTHSRL